MRKLYVISLILLLQIGFTFRGKAQDFGIYVSAGVATMRMDDMKTLLESIMDTYPVEAKVISSFPPYASTSFGFMKRLYPHLKLGAGYGYTTSGAKANYSDYSGSLTTEITAVSHRLGGLVAYSPFTLERLEFSILGRLDLNLTRMGVSSLLYASGFSTGLDEDYTSFSPQVSVYADILYHLGKFSLGLEGGYLVDVQGKLKGEGGAELTPRGDPMNSLSSDWTGWRAAIKGILWLDNTGN